MALPTAFTPGYTTYAGKVSCVCLAAWLPWLEKLALAHGYIKYRLDVLQLTGDYSMSGGTHNAGGVYDIKQYDTRIVALAREMGAPATWLRNMNYANGSPGNTHTHGVLSGCPHNWPARYQITAQKRGYNGMGQGWYGGSYLWGYGGRDPHPDPKVYRTWQQGIEWAKAELVRLTGSQILDNITTPSEEDELMAITVKHPITGAQVPIQDALWSMWTYILEQRDDPDETARKVWEQTISRDGGLVSVKQELADAKSIARRIENNLGDLGEKVDALDTAVAALPDSPELAAVKAAVDALRVVVEESHLPKAEPAKVPATQYGVDVSGWQTVERVDTVAADPKYGFVIVKASQGQQSGNAYHDSQVADVRRAGLCVGHYHFAECDQDPILELENFLARAKAQPGDIVALDAEDWDQKLHPERMANTPWTQRLDFVLRWLEEAERRLGVRPLIYVNWNWIKGLRTAATLEQWERLTRFDVWIAQWLLKGAPIQPGGFEHIDDKDGSPDGWTVAIHQWTNNDNGLDGNFMPDPSAWAKYAIPSTGA